MRVHTTFSCNTFAVPSTEREFRDRYPSWSINRQCVTVPDWRQCVQDVWTMSDCTARLQQYIHTYIMYILNANVMTMCVYILNVNVMTVTVCTFQCFIVQHHVSYNFK